MTVSDSTIDYDSGSSGGNIDNSGGTLTVNDSTIDDNDGGGIENLGGTLIVNDSIIDDNDGGGIANASGTLTDHRLHQVAYNLRRRFISR